MIFSLRFLGLRVGIHWSVPLAVVALVYVLAGRGIWLRGLQVEGALLASGLLALFYLSTEVVHQFGHALTARLIGHPMSGFRLWWWFTWSEYPPDEPTLPAHVHIIRALGGAAAHGLMFALAYWIFLQTRGAAPWLDYFGILSWLFGLYFFVVSAFVTDGVAFLMMRGWRGTFLELDRRVQSESVE